MRVIAAMSGGVDSAVAAARLVEAGHEVLGVHLALKGGHPGTGKGCGSPTDASDAAEVARRLGIDFEVWDFADRFRSSVVDYFLDEYASGRTPNPCLKCNSTIKFATLQERGSALGFEAVGTGHYARVDPDVPALYRSRCLSKDQSYVLAVLTPAQLRRTLFPLGDFATKDDVRAEAEARGLDLVSDKPDSTDICFIPDGDTQGFLERRLGEVPGDIVDEAGAVVGQHRGTHRFTVGQRKGLRIGRPTDDGRPRYVLDISPETRTVRVGPREAGEVTHIDAGNPNWLVDPSERRALVQIRAHGRPLSATITPAEAGLRATLDEPHAGVAAGQGLVAYDGDQVLVQGVIASSRRAGAPGN